VDKQLRERLKHDKFVEEVGHTVHYLQDHKSAVKRYGGIAAAVLAVVIGVWTFMNWRAGQRQEDLRQAALTLDAFIGDQSPTGGLAFPTQAEKDAAVQKAFSEVAAKHPGTKEGQLGRYYSATQLCDQGKVAECEAGYKQAIQDGSDANVTSLAKLSLATLLISQNKMDEAEKVARELVNNPSPVVSKEQGQILLAQTLLKSKPQEARILLEALQAVDRPAVTRAAVALMGELTGQQVPR
jgi:predicted negative regulator of RcsB-dependent stress response